MASKSLTIFLIFVIFFQESLEIDYNAESLRIHQQYKGKLSVISKLEIKDSEDLSIAYTPGVAEPCKKIAKDKNNAFRYTIKGHTVAVVSDGSAVLGLGDIGPDAALPVMEGKAVLFKEFGGVDAFPICLDTKDPDEIVKTVKFIAPTFGGINLEDISSPRCFEIEEKLISELNIPVFHDDQHGTSIVVTAGIINALKLVKKEWKDLKIVVAGAGAAGLSVVRLLLDFEPYDIILTNRKGAVYEGRPDLNPIVAKMAKITNKEKKKGTLADVLVGADIFIGVSGPNLVTTKMIKSMNEDPIVFALANPYPEIMPEDAFKGGARIVATGRSDFPNQINNLLAFPGIFRGALMVRSTKIVDDMKVAAAKALASLVSDRELNEKMIIPTIFDKRCAKVIAEEVAKVAEDLGLALNLGNRDCLNFLLFSNLLLFFQNKKQ